MKTTTLKYLSFVLLLGGVISGCRKAYNPKIIDSPNSYLVVEGVINSGNDSTFIKLSKTVKLSETVSSGLSGAVVTVEGENNDVYPFQAIGAGVYAAPPLHLIANNKYRLHIKLDDKEYISDLTDAIITPEIDNVDYKVKSNGIQINVNTHDAASNTRFYRWDYTETYLFHSDYQSLYKSNGDTVLDRDMDNDQIYKCWHTDNSSNIIIGSSEKLANNVISDAPVSLIATPSEKLVERYSILVRQYAISKEAYQFWQNLQKNTEQLGSIFDAQPSQLKGNIHCVTEPAETVIGYISVCNVTTKRIFINSSDLPDGAGKKPGYGCSLDTFLFKHVLSPNQTVNDENIYFNYKKNSGNILAIPVEQLFDPAHNLAGHLGSSPQCVDCTLHGTNKQPAFWK